MCWSGVGEGATSNRLVFRPVEQKLGTNFSRYWPSSFEDLTLTLRQVNVKITSVCLECDKFEKLVNYSFSLFCLQSMDLLILN